MGTRIRYDTFFSNRPNPFGFLAMRHFLISALLLTLVAGCSGGYIASHRIDVQQGNALDQENVARLKPGLSRSQVRFLLGTPLMVDPFRTDRWDYVYRYYKAGKLTEQKRITLFFDGDTLARIEGDMPDPAAQVPATEPPAQPVPVDPGVAPAPAAPVTSIVPTLHSPQDVPAHGDPRPAPDLRLKAEGDATRIRPDMAPPFAGTGSEPDGRDARVLKAVDEWAVAWSRRDESAYFSAYDERFVPEERLSRAEWEYRKPRSLDAARDIEVRIDSPSVSHVEEGTVAVAFNQSYRSGSYRDAVVKQLQMVEQDGRWLIVEEKAASVLRGSRS
jgi:outer membrane protein assembly factor BamE